MPHNGRIPRAGPLSVQSTTASRSHGASRLPQPARIRQSPIDAIHRNSKEEISCIPNNMEKYMSVSLAHLKFIDSLQFLNSSLDKLVDNMKDLCIFVLLHKSTG